MTIDEQTFDSQEKDELRRRGLELQAALPLPHHSRWFKGQRDRSEGDDASGEAALLALEFGLIGLLLALPYMIIRLLRRLGRFADSATDPGPR